MMFSFLHGLRVETRLEVAIALGELPAHAPWRSNSCGRVLDALGRNEGRKALAGVEHAGLHGALRYAENLGHLPDRLLLIVDEIDDRGVRAREGGKRTADHGAGFLPAELRLGVAARVNGILGGLAVERF